jgi:hypothetical protein
MQDICGPMAPRLLILHLWRQSATIIQSFGAEAGEAAPELLELLKAPDIYTRIWAADALGYHPCGPESACARLDKIA